MSTTNSQNKLTILCIIPAYNEEAFVGTTLDSLLAQSYIPTEIIIVNDGSTDQTLQIIQKYAQKHPFIKVLNLNSEHKHMPGSKVINAFNQGLQSTNQPFDILVKLDADLILPENYFETIEQTFRTSPQVGMAGGFAYIQKDNQWILEQLTDTDHIRGAFKAYRKECFQAIGGLKPSMGWDTVDELLAKYHNWQVITLPKLKVKHLKPTGKTYTKEARYKQGEAFYKLGYGPILTTIASAKLAYRKKNIRMFIDYIIGYLKAQKNQTKKLVNKDEAQFIRTYRWTKIKHKIFG